MNVPGPVRAGVLVALMLAIYPAQDETGGPRPSSHEPSAADSNTSAESGPDATAQALLAQLGARTARHSFAAAATLTIHRPGRTREILLRVYYHQPLDRWLLRVDGRVRERGLRVLLADQRTHVRFPAAELTVELPSALGGERLLGSDFGVDDLAVLADAGRRFDARLLGRSEDGPMRLVHLGLRPREDRASLYGSVRLTLVEQNAAPRLLEFLGDDGAVVRRVEMEGTDALPQRWTATTPGRPGWESTLEVEHFDPSPLFHEQLFTVDGLAR